MDQDKSPIIGIDLGTTNSVVAAYVNGKIRVLQEDGEAILPSVVGLTLDGKLVVGQTAKNQLAAFPERTIMSVKRRMGEAVQLKLADQTFSPQEISAIILRRLRQRAEQILETEVTRAVITVPAFFDEDQRQATREAGVLAGLKVERIINEPTAASLVYHAGTGERRQVIVYDLGGGTFDVSIVRIEGGVIEVLSSKGDTKLGGDDFDELLSKHVSDMFFDQHGIDLLSQSNTHWRLKQACERAKCELSTMSSVRITEEFIAEVNGQPVSLDVEVTRSEYENLIFGLVQRTIECVDLAIRDAGLTTMQLDELILVGGSTRTPLVQRRLREEFKREPLWSVNPDLAVALGAATQGAMQAGNAIGPVLIDIATHTLGVDALNPSSILPQAIYVPIIHRNSPLPAKYEEVFETISLDQRTVVINVFQGESSELSQNRKIGSFKLDGLNQGANADGEILVRFELTLDGVLRVEGIERQSKIATQIKIDNALSRMGIEQAKTAGSRLETLFDGSDELLREWSASDYEDEDTFATASTDTPDGSIVRVDDLSQPSSKVRQLLDKAKSVREGLSEEDTADIDRLVQAIEEAQNANAIEKLDELRTELDDLLFYLAE